MLFRSLAEGNPAGGVPGDVRGRLAGAPGRGARLLQPASAAVSASSASTRRGQRRGPGRWVGQSLETVVGRRIR